MKNGKMIFSALLMLATGGLLYSAARLSAFFGAWDAFLPVKMKFDSLAAASVGFEPSYSGLVSGADSLLFKVPSIAPDYSQIPGAFDLVSVITKDNTLIFTVIPSAASFRPRETTAVLNLAAPRAGQAGEIAEFSCLAGNNFLFSSKACVEGNFTPLAAKGEKLK